MGIRRRTARDGKPFGRDPTCMLDRRSRGNAGRRRREVVDKPVNHSLTDRGGGRVPSRELAEPAESTDIDLGRRTLVADLGKMRGNAVHLATKRSAAKALQHLRILEIQLQHGALPLRATGTTPCPRETRDEILLCGGKRPASPSSCPPLERAATYPHPTHRKGSWTSVSLTTAARPSMPFRKSNGRIATSTRTPDGGAIIER